MTPVEWKTDDRAVLNPALADGWLQPFRRFAEQGRVGRLTLKTEPGRFGARTTITIIFESLTGRGQVYTTKVLARDILPAADPRQEASVGPENDPRAV